MYTLVFGLIAVSSLLKSVTSTNDISIPICVATTLEKYLLVPNNKITTGDHHRVYCLHIKEKIKRIQDLWGD